MPPTACLVNQRLISAAVEVNIYIIEILLKSVIRLDGNTATEMFL